MPKEETLQRVQSDLDRGNLGKARDRLHGLITTYPSDLSLRTFLGEVYSRLQYPETAGRYWYLEENKTDLMEAACEQFERSCGSDSMQILCRLNFRGSIQDLESEYARSKLLSLRRECLRKHHRYPDFRKKGAERWEPRFREKVADKLIPVGCFVVLLAVIVLAIIGVHRVVRWLGR